MTVVSSAEQAIKLGVQVAKPVDHVLSQPIDLGIETVDASIQPLLDAVDAPVQPLLDTVDAITQTLLNSENALVEGMEFRGEGINQNI